METSTMFVFVVGHLAAGAVAFLADERWGRPLRGQVIDLCSRVPVGATQGFLVGRTASVKLVWAFAASSLLATVCAMLGMAWYLAGIQAVAGAFVTWAGLHLMPGVRWAWGRAVHALDRVDALEKHACEQAPGLRARLAARVRTVAAAVRAAFTRAPAREAAPPRPTYLSERQARIDRMDRMLGR